MPPEQAEQVVGVDSTLQEIKTRTANAKLVDEFVSLLKVIPASDIVLTRGEHSDVSAIPFAVGGYADIYRGTLGSGGPNTIAVAVKVFRGAHIRAAGDQEKKDLYNNRLRREYAAWGELTHPNVLPLKGLVILPSLPSAGLVSEFKRHGNLLDLLKKGIKKGKEYDPLAMAQGVACGLQYLHSKDVVHGDITPANVLVDKDQKGRFYPLITDFGKSRLLEREGYTTEVNSTPMIAKPPELLEVCENEVATNKEYLTHASDVYSFSLLLLLLVTGKHAYSQEKLPTFTITGRIVDRSNPLRPVPEKYPLLDKSYGFCWPLMQACWKPEKEDRITSGEAHSWLRTRCPPPPPPVQSTVLN